MKPFLFSYLSMNKSLFLLFVLFLGANNGFAQQIQVTGNAASYAGDVLEIRAYGDYLTHTEVVLAKAEVQQNGDFEFRFSLQAPKEVFIHLNVFKGIWYAEVGENYLIELPEKVTKLEEDKLNPFFKEQEFYFDLSKQNASNLTSQILHFDKLYNKEAVHIFEYFNGRVNKTKIDSSIAVIDSKLVDYNQAYFDQYKYYSYLLYRYTAYWRNKDEIRLKEFAQKDILYHNIVYMDMFNRLFDGFILDFAKSTKGILLPAAIIQDESRSKALAVLDSVTIMEGNEKLKELILIKGMYESLLNDIFPPESTFAILEQIKLNSPVDEHRKIATNVIDLTTKLRIGFEVPDFVLPNKRNKKKRLSSFRTKFVYLSFIQPNNYACEKEMEMLNQFYSQGLKNIEVVSVFVGENVEQMNDFVKQKDYGWTFLFFDQQYELLKDYRVKAYPTFYLLDPDGRVVMLPAVPPSDSFFEVRFNKAIQAWMIEMRRRQNQQGVGN